MNSYRMNRARLLRGTVMLILAAAVAAFIFETFKGYTPFGYRGEYIEGRVERVLKFSGSEEIQCIDVVYNVGLTRFDTRLPSAVWYLEGTEVGDTFTVPYHQHDFDDMNKDERTALAVLIAVFCILLLSAIFPIAGLHTRILFTAYQAGQVRLRGLFGRTGKRRKDPRGLQLWELQIFQPVLS